LHIRALYVYILGCRTSTGTGTGDPVPGSPNPVVGNARWRPLGSQGEKKTRKVLFFIFTAVSTLPIALQAALAAVGRWPNSSSSQPGPVGQSVCGTKTKLITGRYWPVPGTGTGAGHSDPEDPVARWDNLGGVALPGKTNAKDTDAVPLGHFAHCGRALPFSIFFSGRLLASAA
jgi:hypothetical protein